MIIIFESTVRGCCRALTAECLACSKGQSVEQFCADEANKNVLGCEGILIALFMKMTCCLQRYGADNCFLTIYSKRMLQGINC